MGLGRGGGVSGFDGRAYGGAGGGWRLGAPVRSKVSPGMGRGAPSPLKNLLLARGVMTGGGHDGKHDSPRRISYGFA